MGGVPARAWKNPLADPVRVAMLRGTGLLGAPPDEALDRLAALAGTVLEAPIAMLALLDDTHLHARACAGSRHLAKSGRTPVKDSFCQHVVRTAAPLVVRDAREDDLTKGLAVVKSRRSPTSACR